MASRTLQFGEHFYNYVAPEEDPWCETVLASCSTDEIDVTNQEKNHKEDKPEDFTCANCPKQFFTLKLLQLHRKTHEIVESQCNQCDKVFGTKKRLAASKYWIKDFKSDKHGQMLYRGIVHFNSYNV